jgi:hypothetical protein
MTFAIGAWNFALPPLCSSFTGIGLGRLYQVLESFVWAVLPHRVHDRGFPLMCHKLEVLERGTPDKVAQEAKSQEAWTPLRQTTEMCWMASGMYCGPDANGNRSKKNGLESPAVFCMSDFRPGKKAVCLHYSSKRWSNTMLGSAKSDGNGNPWIA